MTMTTSMNYLLHWQIEQALDAVHTRTHTHSQAVSQNALPNQPYKANWEIYDFVWLCFGLLLLFSFWLICHFHLYVQVLMCWLWLYFCECLCACSYFFLFEQEIRLQKSLRKSLCVGHAMLWPFILETAQCQNEKEKWLMSSNVWKMYTRTYYACIIHLKGKTDDGCFYRSSFVKWLG